MKRLALLGVLGGVVCWLGLADSGFAQGGPPVAPPSHQNPWGFSSPPSPPPGWPPQGGPGLGGPGPAGGPPGGRPPPTGRPDIDFFNLAILVWSNNNANRDLRLSAEELANIRDTRMKAVFSAWDTDADGAVSTGEFRKGLRDKQRAFNQARVQQFVASLDRNQDGSIEAGEIAPLRPPEALLDFLAAFDTQGDGRLDPGEIQTMQPFVNPMIDKRMFALNAGLVRLPHPQRQQVERLPPMVQAIFLMANENDDEALTQEEYTGYLRDVLGQAAADIVINQTPLPVPVEESPSGGVASAQTSGLTASSPRGAGEPGNPGSRRGFRSLLTTPGGPDHSVPDALRRGGGEGMDRDLLW